VYVPGRYLHDEQHIQAPEEDRLDGEEVAGEQSLAWVRRNVRQEVSAFGGAGLRRRARMIRRTVASLTW
jgi:hypothetical protein